MTTLHDDTTADESGTAIVDETLAAINASNDPNWAWSKESTEVRMAEPAVVDRQVIGYGDLTALTVNHADRAQWRYVAPFIGLAALTASVVIVMAVDPVAVRDWISPPQPVVATTTVISQPVTQTLTETATVTASPVTETETAAPTVPGPQVFLADMSSQGWKDAPDKQLANGKRACSDLAGPPRRTVLDVARADADYDHIPFPLVQGFVITAAMDLCPQNR